MKKLFLLLAVFGLVFTACESGDNDITSGDNSEQPGDNNNDNNEDNGNEVEENNKIYYTTSDGKKVFPNTTTPTTFGAILISNKYQDDSKGVLTFDDTITSIGGSAFSGCTSLTSITIPNSVTKIGAYAFCRTYLTSITIPDNVTEIGAYAFDYCGVREIYCKPTTPPTAIIADHTTSVWNAFYSQVSNRTIYVPKASAYAYRTADGWSKYAADIVGYDFE